MTNLIVGVDLSAPSEQAVAHAVAVARHLGWEATMVLVDALPEDTAALPASMRELAARWNATLAARVGEHRRRLGELRARWVDHGVELSQIVVDGYPDERLPAVAADLDAALIVVGSHGRTGLARYLVGSVAERVARHAEVDVLVARGDAPDGGYHRVVAGTDFSPQAERAVRHALPYVARGGQLVLAHCWWLPGAGAAAGAALDLSEDDLTGRLAQGLREAGEHLREALAARPDVQLTYDVLPARPAHGLAELAAHHRADLVVVGSHGRRGVRRLVLGSTAEATIRHAPCSVLVAR